MEAKRFDTIAKALFSTSQRRRILSGLLGGALATPGAFGFHRLSDAEAKKGKKEKKKPWCHCPDDDPANCVTRELTKKARQRFRKKHPFDSPGRCEKSSCPAGQTNCDGDCKNLQTDETNCGTCGTSCGAVQGCCGGVCANLNTDENNCGTCGNTCAGGTTCCSGVCVNTQANPANCGGCGNVCAAPAVLCVGGNCSEPPTSPCAAAGADPTCCTGVCLAAGVGGIPFPHCA